MHLRPAALTPQERAECMRLLRSTFHVNGFRPGQEEAVLALLRKRDLLAVFPTGAGKSLCYQLPALLLPGTALVISPLIALMRDQVNHLRALGIPAAEIDMLQSEDEQKDVLRRFAEGRLRLLYVSPERLAQPAFASAAQRVSISMVVADEAHCVLKWGHDFRPEYSEIHAFVDRLPQRPPLCAFTATADRAMRRELVQELRLTHPRILLLPTLRPNLIYQVVPTADKDSALLALLAQHPGERALVFCRTRVRTEAVAALLTAHGRPARAYHAGLTRKQRAAAQQWYDLIPGAVIAATSAFGMGVDIPDIRLLIHDCMPDDLTDYAQQAGRAGRDGQDSRCVILLDPADHAVLASIHHVLSTTARSREQDERTVSAREFRRTMRWMLRGSCLPSGLSAAFGRRTAPCGRCSACLRQQKTRLPLYVMPPRQQLPLRLWVLRWQRRILAEQAGVTPEQVYPASLLNEAARTGLIRPERACSAAAGLLLQQGLDHANSIPTQMMDYSPFT